MSANHRGFQKPGAAPSRDSKAQKSTFVSFRSDAARLFSKSSAIAGAVALAASTQAQEASEPVSATTLPTVVVTDSLSYKAQAPTMTRYTQPLLDVPQTVSVVPSQVIEEQGATSLRDVLRNVPGVTMNAGEGGVVPGDNLTIRGFNSRSDVLVNGVRDLGGQNRDSFNIEQVEVYKGPSSANTGRGSTGGSVNVTSKAPQLDPFYRGTFTGGTDSYSRGEIDLNQPFGSFGGALRLNGVYQNSDTPGRDWVEGERWGVAPSVAFGLGTDTRLTLSYYHLQEDNVPDYGIPWVSDTLAGTSFDRYVNKPAPVKWSNFYGTKDFDYEKTKTDQASILFEHDFTDKLKFRNYTTFAKTEREHAATAPRFYVDSVTGDISIDRTIKTRHIENENWANTSELTAGFDTGTLEHTLLAGVQYSYERQTNYSADSSGISRPLADIFNPRASANTTGSLIWGNNPSFAEVKTASVYLFDTVKIGEQFEVSGGLRYDNVDAEYSTDTDHFSRTDDLLNWRAAIAYKPVEYGTIYFGYGSSFNPSIDGNTLSLSSSNANLDPEESRSFELGTKWELLEKRLMLNAALFRTEKTNARTPDPADPTVTLLNGEQVVQGFEFGFTGSITDNWRVIGGYTYMDSEITESGDPDELHNHLANTPRHSFSLWSVVDITEGLQFGAGAQYVGNRFNNASNTRMADDYILFDAMLSYQVTENFGLRLNVHNLADEEYIDRPGGGHFVPGPGRSVTLSASFDF